MTKAADLRRWLSVNGYCFTEERLVRDKNYLYPVLRVKGGAWGELTELQALTGVLLAEDPLYGEYLAQHEEKLRRAAEGLRRSGREDAARRAGELERLADDIGGLVAALDAFPARVLGPVLFQRCNLLLAIAHDRPLE